MNPSDQQADSTPSSRRLIGALGAIFAFAIAGGIWMHADEHTARALAGGVATAGPAVAVDAAADASLPRASDVALSEREEAADFALSERDEAADVALSERDEVTDAAPPERDQASDEPSTI
jgi:hypothetical protein